MHLIPSLRSYVLISTLAALLPACSDAGSDRTADDDIVGGAAERRFLSVGYLALERADGASLSPFCTGTLIAPRVVATAAHCVHELKYAVAPGGPFMTFTRGLTTSAARAPVPVSLVYEDPAYNPQDPAYEANAGFANDFALLVLERPMEGVTPARIAAADPTKAHLAVGYGRTKSGPYDLVEEGLPKRKSLEMTVIGGSAETYYLSRPDADGSVCYGDSGGPLLELGDDARDVAIVGVTAHMFNLDPNDACMPGTRVAQPSLAAKKAMIDEVLAAASGGGAPAPLELPPAGALPLGKADVLRLDDTRAMAMGSSFAAGADGSLTIVFDRTDAAFTRSELLVAHSRDGRHFTAPEPITLPGAKPAFVASPSAVTVGAQSFLYFESAERLDVRPTLARAPLVAGRLGPVELLPPIAGVEWLQSWPKFAPLADGGLGVAFRDGRSTPFFATSADGMAFGAPNRIALAGAMPDFGQAKDGTLAFSFQLDTPTEPMVSYVRLSQNGGTSWSAPIRISPESNVHDTTILARADGGFDLYYIYPPADHRGFSLFRRALTTAGALGPEERLTSKELGEPSKPQAVRRSDGRIVVAYSEIAERAPTTFEPSVQQIVLAELTGDAPR